VSDSRAGWPIVELGSLLTDIQPGFASGKHNSEGEGIPHFRPMNVSIEGQVNRSVLKYIDPAIADRPTRRLRRGDVVFNNTNSPELVGKTALFEDDDTPAFSNHMTRLRVDASRLDPGFLSLRLHQAWREGWFAAHCNNHVSQASIGRDVLRAFEIELPPLEVQRAIRALSRETDERRASCSDHLASARSTMRRLHQAVLVMACSGRLTAKWRMDSSDAPTSMADVLAEMTFAQKSRRVRRGVKPDAKTDDAIDALDLPRSWTVATVSTLLASGVLEDVKDGNHGANHPKASEFTASGLPFITANVVKDGLIDYDAAPKVGGEALSRLRVGFAKPGDVVLTHKASVGRVAINTEPSVLTPQTTYYRTESSVLSAAYLALFLESLYFYRQLAAVMSQTTRDFVPISQQYLLSVVMPPPAEQEAIVRHVDDLLRPANSLTQRIEAASRRVERSSQAVLAKAFRGELSPDGVEPA
jgi:type I restriction enzyme S subunit